MTARRRVKATDSSPDSFVLLSLDDDSRIDTLSSLLSELAEAPSLHLRRQVLTVAAEVMPISSVGYEHLKRSTLLLLDRASLPIADKESRMTGPRDQKIRIGGLYRCCIQTFESTPLDTLEQLDKLECAHCHSTMVRAADGVWEWQLYAVKPLTVKQEESAT